MIAIQRPAGRHRRPRVRRVPVPWTGRSVPIVVSRVPVIVVLAGAISLGGVLASQPHSSRHTAITVRPSNGSKSLGLPLVAPSVTPSVPPSVAHSRLRTVLARRSAVRNAVTDLNGVGLSAQVDPVLTRLRAYDAKLAAEEEQLRSDLNGGTS